MGILVSDEARNSVRVKRLSLSSRNSYEDCSPALQRPQAVDSSLRKRGRLATSVGRSHRNCSSKGNESPWLASRRGSDSDVAGWGTAVGGRKDARTQRRG